MGEILETAESELYVARRAIYAGSFDPPTIGHQWVIERAARQFDELHVAIGINPDKKSMFDVDERVEMLKDISSNFDNVTVGHFGNKFLIHHAEDIGVDCIVRGLRSPDDYKDELKLERFNRRMNPNIDTWYLGCPEEYAIISSSFVKGLLKPERREEAIRDFVTPFVFNALMRRINETRQ